MADASLPLKASRLYDCLDINTALPRPVGSFAERILKLFHKSRLVSDRQVLYAGPWSRVDGQCFLEVPEDADIIDDEPRCLSR